ncbi:exocyst complex component EXO84C-like [Populus alba x Populus x berolinensis]|nr:exocyst complex component EXO84C-like [Populus alba x Populus x berolinensis]
MESSEEDDDFPFIESITPQSKIDSLYQSHTEKGIRKVCCELIDLKDAVENLCGNMETKYLAFLRMSEEVVEMEHELIELRKHISAQRILVQDLMTGVCRELEEYNSANGDIGDSQQDLQVDELQSSLPSDTDIRKEIFLENIDVLLAEHKVEEAIEALEAEEKYCLELKGPGDTSSMEASYRSVFLKRKSMLEDQLIGITEQPLVGILELKKALSALIKLGKGPLAHQLLLKSYGSRLQKSIEVFLPSCSVYPKTFPATLSRLMFSIISVTTKESGSIFGDNPVYTNRLVQWAEWEIEYFVRLVKNNAPSSETVFALGAASNCVQASLTYCSMLESQGLKLSKLLLVLLRPYIEEVLEFNFRRARREALDVAEMDESSLLSPHSMSPLSAFVTSSDSVLVDSGMKFMDIVEDILAQLTPMAVLHFGANVLTRISQLFDKYMDMLFKSLPGPSDDDNLTELKEVIQFRAETDSEQLALLGLAFTILDELLPLAVMKVWSLKNESKELESESTVPNASITAELKEWKRNLQHSFDKLRDHFCRQYVLTFIYSREGKTRLNALIYLSGEGEDLYWGSDPLPSLPFQALFAKLQQLAIVAGDVLLGREKIQKNLLARLTETVVMWLSEEQEFWDVFEDESVPLRPLGLQQLILDMHFTVEIACFAGYPSRHVQQIASAIITRAIRTFSARGIDPQSALPEDEWFVETAKTAINKLLLGTSGSDASEIDEDHVILHDEMVSDSDETASSLSSTESFESFASASMGELDSPVYFTEVMLTNVVGKYVVVVSSILADKCVEVEEMKVEEAHFRGRKLQGATLPIPDGYSGFVIGKKSPGKRKASDMSEQNSNTWEITAKFENITYWNHDSLPSKVDAFVRSLHWLSVAEALHKPAAAEDLASASIALEKK